jgi:hypothetical protein
MHWHRVSHTPFRSLLRGVSFTDKRHGWVVDATRIYHTTNGGVTWREQTPPRGMTFLSDISFINKQDGAAVGATAADAAVATTTDGGATWRLSYTGSSGAFFRVSRGAGCTMATGNDRSGSAALIAISRLPQTWRRASPPPGAGAASGAWCSPSGQVVVAQDGIKTAIFTKLVSQHWKRARTPTRLGTGQLVVGYGRWWFAGDGGVTISP